MGEQPSEKDSRQGRGEVQRGQLQVPERKSWYVVFIMSRGASILPVWRQWESEREGGKRVWSGGVRATAVPFLASPQPHTAPAQKEQSGRAGQGCKENSVSTDIQAWACLLGHLSVCRAASR